MAPLLRPVLEHVPPVRWLAKKLLGGQPAQVQIEGLDFQVHQADFGVTLEAFWGYFGSMWMAFGDLWATLKSLWDHFGIIFGI